MSDQQNRSEIIFHTETKVPVGSTDKRKVRRLPSDELYPLPRPHPVPWQED
ncbi:hypothetical protein NDK47_00195 [Brevibacillus ruminantium]|uniref:Uncharacterized protein n=1 Tax=Brevibacillus ruminantium TaxID=2950604 RepID=A0ABY4WKF8_9BACL|nr:hypothetical protein [Brevibacillus ruminantium]USG65839.1 hypothetical protein NDK47_00195 [Brevibacillus ruminantium]